MGVLTARRVLAGVPLVAAMSLALGAAASCGSRTGLPEEETTLAPGADAAATVDADADEEIRSIDAFHPDVPVINLCPDAAATLIYVIGKSGTLYSFDPSPPGTFTRIGPIRCPGSVGTPFSMAVDREGVAYVIFSRTPQGSNATFGTGLFRVSTKTSECTPTAYDANKNGQLTFGMGFVAHAGDGGDAGEELFISLDLSPTNITTNGELATLDTTTFEQTDIAKFSPAVDGAELAGTADGRLFAFSPSVDPGGSFIAQIDPTTAKVIAEDPLPGIVQGEGWAFGFWGGDFYTFTTAGQSFPTTEVNRFDPVSKTITPAGTINDTIVGAGVSTCAPQE